MTTRQRLSGMLNRVFLLIALLAATSSTRAEDKLTRLIRNWKLIEEGVELTVNLEELREQIRQQAPELAKQHTPEELRGDFEWAGKFRFSNLRIVIDEVHFRKAAQANRIDVEIRGGLEANREKREVHIQLSFSEGIKLQSEWVADGTKRLADLKLDGGLHVSVSGPRQLLVLTRADAVDWNILLNLFKGTSGRVDLGAHKLRDTELNLPSLETLGVKLSGARVIEASDQEAVLVLDLTEVEDEAEKAQADEGTTP